MKTEAGPLEYDEDEGTVICGIVVVAEVYGPEHFPCADESEYEEMAEEQSRLGHLFATTPEMAALIQQVVSQCYSETSYIVETKAPTRSLIAKLREVLDKAVPP